MAHLAVCLGRGAESPTDQLLALNFGRPSSQHTGAPPGHPQRRKANQTLCWILWQESQDSVQLCRRSD